MEDIIQVNTNEDNFYNKQYEVFFYSGCGIWGLTFHVYANDEESAIYQAVAYCDNNNLHGVLIDTEAVLYL